MSAHDKPGFWKLIEISLSLFSPHWRDEQIHELASEAPCFPQREQSTDEVPVQRFEQAVQYPLHQHEDEASNRPCLQWWQQQPVLQPRYVAPIATGPKTRTQCDGFIQQVVPQVGKPGPGRWRRVPDGMGGYRIVPPQSTDAMEKLASPQTPVPSTQPNPMQLLSQDELPDWLRRSLPSHPGKRVEATGNVLASMRKRDRYELEKTPIDELPTVPDVHRLTEDALNALSRWQAPAIPPAIQFWTAPDEPDFVENRWLNEPAPAAPPVLQPMTNNDPAAGDKLAASTQRETDKPTTALTRLAALAVQTPTRETVEVPNAMRERARRMQAQQRERE